VDLALAIFFSIAAPSSLLRPILVHLFSVAGGSVAGGFVAGGSVAGGSVAGGRLLIYFTFFLILL